MADAYENPYQEYMAPVRQSDDNGSSSNSRTVHPEPDYGPGPGWNPTVLPPLSHPSRARQQAPVSPQIAVIPPIKRSRVVASSTTSTTKKCLSCLLALGVLVIILGAVGTAVGVTLASKQYPRTSFLVD